MSYLKSNTRQPRLDFEVDIQDTGMMKDAWKKAREKANEALEKGKKWYEKGKRVANAAREEMRKNSSDA